MQRIDVAIEAAKIGGNVIRSGRCGNLEIREKDSSRTSIVTATDLQSQQEIVRVIQREYPTDLIVGEEGNAGETNAEWRWYIDPLDGTSNYAHDLPFYCVSISSCDHAGIAVGIVYDPLREEMFTAVRGGGANLNGRSIKVSSSQHLRTSLISTQIQSDNASALDHYVKRLRTLLSAARAVRSFGAPALALAYVACGRLDAFLEDCMAPWDTLAGTLLVEEAGGRVSAFDGATRPTGETADILATNGSLHDGVIAQLRNAQLNGL